MRQIHPSMQFIFDIHIAVERKTRTLSFVLEGQWRVGELVTTLKARCRALHYWYRSICMILDVYRYCMCMCIYIYTHTLYQLSGEKSPFSTTPCIYLCTIHTYITINLKILGISLLKVPSQLIKSGGMKYISITLSWNIAGWSLHVPRGKPADIGWYWLHRITSSAVWNNKDDPRWRVDKTTCFTRSFDSFDLFQSLAFHQKDLSLMIFDYLWSYSMIVENLWQSWILNLASWCHNVSITMLNIMVLIWGEGTWHFNLHVTYPKENS